MEEKIKKISNITNKLFDYSNHYIELRMDNNLTMPAFSVVEKNMSGRYVPYILINLNLIPDNYCIISHIMSHEWGHHVLNHLKVSKMENISKTMEYYHRFKNTNNQVKKKFHKFLENLNKDKQQKENEADGYAAQYIKVNNIDKKPIIDFLKSHPFDLQNRLNILNS